MKVFLIIALLLCLTGFSVPGYTQRINNPSFEGLPQQNVPPPPWAPCNTFSMPDTQPGFWNVRTPASDRDTYLGLLTRGNTGAYANTIEAVQIRLNSKIANNDSHSISIDLAFSDTQGYFNEWGSFVSYANPVILNIWGGASSCEKTELLWESPPINHTNWKTYELTLMPEAGDVNYLILEANYIDPPHFGTYFGNILIDNIQEKDIPEPPLSDCTLETFNVFTPNGDGYNDVFLLKPVSDITRFHLKIYNRWGQLLFETSDVEKGWDGKARGNECTPGIYYWYTEFACTSGNRILRNTMKGTLTLLK